MLYEQLSENEIQMIESYISHYATGDYYNSTERQAPLTQILSHWEKYKVDLFNLLGQQLIVSKNVEVSVSYHYVREKMRKLLQQYDFFRNQIMDIYRSEQSEYYTPNAYTILDYIFASSQLASNSIPSFLESTLPLPDGKTLRVHEGMKTIKVIGKIAQAFGIEGFEAFRIDHSKILNTQTMRGKLCLSIHPLDFMTMSDNNCNWTSCMSWKNTGGYRLGTVEMMNSPVALVAYLTSDEPYTFPGGEWNSKKWRSLFLVTPDLITSVKGYPYQSKEMIDIVLEWLGELSMTNLGREYQTTQVCLPSEDCAVQVPGCPESVNVCFTTGYMYNDFGAVDAYGTFAKGFDKSYVEIYYSGPASCMWCGECENGFEDEGELVCRSCRSSHYCDCCGDHFYGPMYTVGDNLVCEYCFNNRIVIDAITGKQEFDYNTSTIYYCTDIQSGAGFAYAGCVRFSDQLSREVLQEYFIRTNWHSHYHGFWNLSYYCTPDMLTDKGAELFFGPGTTREDLMNRAKSKTL